jgi:heterodisulfide reductase subunit A
LVKAHPNITLWAHSDVTKVEGYVGNFKVEVARRPRYIHENLCSGCLECIEACVYKEPKFIDEFNMGLGKRKPIYIPFPQAVPQMPLIDIETCIQFKSGKCKKTCVQACGDRHAIDFSQQEGYTTSKSGRSSWRPPRRSMRGGAYHDTARIRTYMSLEVERL